MNSIHAISFYYEMLTNPQIYINIFEYQTSMKTSKLKPKWFLRYEFFMSD